VHCGTKTYENYGVSSLNILDTGGKGKLLYGRVGLSLIRVRVSEPKKGLDR
jgi:hypothetical protein